MVLLIIALASSSGETSKLPGVPRPTVRALAAGVIETARRRQRRRRLRLALALALAIAIGAALANSLRGAQHTANVNGRPVRGLPLLAPAAVLSQSPYMGVACPQPNATACDRVGLAIWLKRPAISVNATIAGQPLKLDWAGEATALRNQQTQDCLRRVPAASRAHHATPCQADRRPDIDPDAAAESGRSGMAQTPPTRSCSCRSNTPTTLGSPRSYTSGSPPVGDRLGNSRIHAIRCDTDPRPPGPRATAMLGRARKSLLCRDL